VADLVASGLSNRQIAVAMVITESTVMLHIKHILSKLGFRSRSQVAARAHSSHCVCSSSLQPGSRARSLEPHSSAAVSLLRKQSDGRSGDPESWKRRRRFYSRIRIAMSASGLQTYRINLYRPIDHLQPRRSIRVTHCTHACRAEADARAQQEERQGTTNCRSAKFALALTVAALRGEPASRYASAYGGARAFRGQVLVAPFWDCATLCCTRSPD